METVTVRTGSIQRNASGTREYDDTRQVEFLATPLGSLTIPGIDHNGGPSEWRGTTQTLYHTLHDRLVVHVEDWSRWQGEPTDYRLELITKADLQVGGQFERLGAKTGFGRPLTLDEALEAQGSAP